MSQGSELPRPELFDRTILSCTVFSVSWRWQDVVDCLPEDAQDAFYALPGEYQRVLIEKHTATIMRGMRAGIMHEWTTVMRAAIDETTLKYDISEMSWEVLQESKETKESKESKEVTEQLGAMKLTTGELYLLLDLVDTEIADRNRSGMGSTMDLMFERVCLETLYSKLRQEYEGKRG